MHANLYPCRFDIASICCFCFLCLVFAHRSSSSSPRRCCTALEYWKYAVDVGETVALSRRWSMKCKKQQQNAFKFHFSRARVTIRIASYSCNFMLFFANEVEANKITTIYTRKTNNLVCAGVDAGTGKGNGKKWSIRNHDLDQIVRSHQIECYHDLSVECRWRENIAEHRSVCCSHLCFVCMNECTSLRWIPFDVTYFVRMRMGAHRDRMITENIHILCVSPKCWWTPSFPFQPI